MDDNARQMLLHDVTLIGLYLKSVPGSEEGTLESNPSFDQQALAALAAEGLIQGSSTDAGTVLLTPEGAQSAAVLTELYAMLGAGIPHALPQTPKAIAKAPAFRLKVDLDLGGPPCSRTIAVAQGITFEELHEAIQAAFLWWDYHAFSFHLMRDGKTITIAEEPDTGASGDMTKDASTFVLDEDCFGAGPIIYEYDGWKHTVELLGADESWEGELPSCIEGVGDAPPEDVGGPAGFQHFLAALSNPEDPDHVTMQRWGKSQGYAPFSVEAVNRRMRTWPAGEEEDGDAILGSGFAAGDEGAVLNLPFLNS